MTPEALDALVASGATVEMIAAAWKAEMALAPKRSTSAERMARKRARDAEQPVTVTSDASDASDAIGVTVTPPPAPAPSFPQTPNQPHPHTPGKTNRAGAHTRGTRIPADFEVPDDWLRWAMGERDWAESDAVTEGQAFGDYWRAKPGRDGLKVDWPATWRNWVRNSKRQTRSRVRDPVFDSPC